MEGGGGRGKTVKTLTFEKVGVDDPLAPKVAPPLPTTPIPTPRPRSAFTYYIATLNERATFAPITAAINIEAPPSSTPPAPSLVLTSAPDQCTFILTALRFPLFLSRH